MDKFKSGDEVKMISYKGDCFYDDTVGQIDEEDISDLKNTTGKVVRTDKSYGCSNTFYVVDFNVNSSQITWWIHEDDLELVKNETSVKIEIDASKAIEQIQSIVRTGNSVTLRGCDVNFLFDQFELDNINGKKYTALLQHFIDNP